MHICAGHDVFVIAPTGAGKSTIMQGAVLADQAQGILSIAITLVPTKSLAEDQARATNNIDGLEALALHRDSVTAAKCQHPPRDLFKEIENGKYTHIYMGPEMIMNEGFGAILAKQKFYERFRYFGIDEAHMLVEWGSFRDAFADVRRLRNRFRGLVTWMAVSATIEPTREFPVLMDLFGFQTAATEIIRLPVDRQSVSYSPRFFRYASSTTGTEFLDLSFVIPCGAKCIDDITATVVFAGEIRQVNAIAEYLTGLLPKTIPEQVHNRVVLPINSVMSSTHNTDTIESIRAGDCTRVLVCTDTGALGIDVARIKQIVILVDQGTSFRMICQKIGRARTSGRAILLFLRWMDTTRTGSSDVAMRANVERVILDFANATEAQCPRAVNKAYWGDTDTLSGLGDHPCCNRHDLKLDAKDLEDVKEWAGDAKNKKIRQMPQLRSDRTHLPPDEVVMQPIARRVIGVWREKHLPDSIGYDPHLSASTILPDCLVHLLARKLHICTTFERFRDVMSTWNRLEEWGESLYELVGEIWQEFESSGVDSSVLEIQAQWKASKTKHAAQDEVQKEVEASHVIQVTAQSSQL
ncbi:hypothetical protein FRC10_005639 [Ceratobasidium sp. 414]|nr:hypothetical protein FRC10_005639 [Ceratobasidium sp. 414]